MLVALSDIHFVDGTAGEHNLPYSAFESVFLVDVASLAVDKQAKELKVLLVGDIVDLIRSTKWLDIDPQDRPWGDRGLADIPSPRKGSETEKQCLKILGKVSPKSLEKPEAPASLARDTIVYKNWKTFKFFRELEARLEEKTGKRIPVQVIYLPGNHDRLCNLYPSVRDEMSKLLGLSVQENAVEGDPGGVWWFANAYRDPDHGVFARHGHQYDVWNFGGGNHFSREDHLQAAIGDIFTTEFAVKIPWVLDRLRKAYPKVTKEMVESTRDIDNVRPLSAVMEWIYYRIKKEDHSQVREALDKAFDTIVKDLLDFKLVRQWRSPHTYVDEALRLISNRWLSWLPKSLLDAFDAEDLLPLLLGMTGEPEEPEKDIYTHAAYRENVWREENAIRFILYGHTHVPLQRPLDGEGGREVFYLNTGTWRNRIYKTVGLDKAHDFVELKQMTFSIFYRKDEDPEGKRPGTMSFEVWTGTKKKDYNESAVA